LSHKDAFQAMLNGETLYDKDGVRYMWSGVAFLADNHGRFYRMNDGPSLYRRSLKKRTRDMTRWEVLDWANSEASWGWLVKLCNGKTWHIPQMFDYDRDLSEFRRARLLPDKSGIDESSIQGFEVEE
jgi:hypothetical protein